MAITYNNLYLDIRRQLRGAGIEAATLEARELVCFGTGKSREQLQRDGGLYASPELERRVRDLVDRHLAGEPVAYLIGEWEFYGLPLDISREVLIPRPDTEVLAEQAINYLRTQGECRVLDLCAGSGCIGLAVAAQAPQARVVLGEWSDGALKICRQNVRRNSDIYYRDSFNLPMQIPNQGSVSQNGDRAMVNLLIFFGERRQF